jgi:divalent metal cation (Fe/Co/Zn/Cd) transporter
MARQALTRLLRWLSVDDGDRHHRAQVRRAYITGSVGLLSDAVEGVVNLLAAILALVVLTYAAEAPDSEHNFGHEKAEYFSSGSRAR